MKAAKESDKQSAEMDEKSRKMERQLEVLKKESQKLKKELEEKMKELFEKAHLQEEFDALCKAYKEEHKLNVTMENSLPQMYASFWKEKEKLAWLDNYKEAILVVCETTYEEE